MPTARFHSSLDDIDAAAWNALRPDDNPFLEHAFLAGLERLGCAVPSVGWQPHHLALYDDDDRLTAAAPLYLKSNSHGEFVFDWSWAGAYERNGLGYYPKLLCAVPYSPVTCARLLVGTSVDADERRALLIELMRKETARLRLSSAHLNFATEIDAAAFEGHDWLPRFDWQFHWENRGYRDFADFLDALSSKKRKNIRQERAQAARAGVVCEIRDGDALTDADWSDLHRFYRSTFDERGNYPALSERFFRHLGATMPTQVLGVLCRRDGKSIAGALLLRSRDTLFGRYWGAVEHVPGLHFEACYYQGIEYCIANGLARFEPGAQGEHKLARGFLPTRTRSFHWIADRRFRVAIADALARERAALEDYRDELLEHDPYARSLE